MLVSALSKKQCFGTNTQNHFVFRKHFFEELLWNTRSYLLYQGFKDPTVTTKFCPRKNRCCLHMRLTKLFTLFRIRTVNAKWFVHPQKEQKQNTYMTTAQQTLRVNHLLVTTLHLKRASTYFQQINFSQGFVFQRKAALSHNFTNECD